MDLILDVYCRCDGCCSGHRSSPYRDHAQTNITCLVETVGSGEVPSIDMARHFPVNVLRLHYKTAGVTGRHQIAALSHVIGCSKEAIAKPLQSVLVERRVSTPLRIVPRVNPCVNGLSLRAAFPIASSCSRGRCLPAALGPNPGHLRQKIVNCCMS